MTEDIVTLKELFALALRRGKFVLCIAVICAILIGSIQISKAVSLAKSDENTEEKIEERYQNALEIYVEQKKSLEKQLAAAKQTLASQQEYNEHSLKMRLDPYNEAVSTISLAITEVNPEVFQQVFLLEETPIDYIISKIQNQYLIYWNSLDLEQALYNNVYPRTSDKYLREIVHLTIANGGSLTITALGETRQNAQTLANAVYDCLLTAQPTISNTAYPHTFTMINQTTKILVDEDIKNVQQTNYDNISLYEADIAAREQSLADLAEPVRETSYSASAILHTGVKWVGIGAVMGFFIALLWIFLTYVTYGYIESVHRVTSIRSLVFLGTTISQKTIWERLANRLLGEKVWTDISKQSEYLSESLRFYLPEKSQIAVLSTLPLAADSPSVRALTDVLSAHGHSVQFLERAGENPKTIQALQHCDSVILAERIGVSRWETFMENEVLAKHTKTPIYGFVTI